MSERKAVRFLKDSPDGMHKAGDLYQCRTIEIERLVSDGVIEVVGREKVGVAQDFATQKRASKIEQDMSVPVAEAPATPTPVRRVKKSKSKK